MKRIYPLAARGLALAGLAVLVTGAADSYAPPYGDKTVYYSSSSHTQAVGGWLSCPPPTGMVYWGTTSSYSVYYHNTTDCYE